MTDSWIQKWEQEAKERREKAKTAILAVCDQLAADGITHVVAHYDGSGDEGCTDDPIAFQTDDPEEYDQENGDAPANTTVDLSALADSFDALVPDGYENNEGGFGDVILNVATRKITIVANTRFEDYTTETSEA